jgi:DNA-binding NarL/FixJ family response regulator
MSEIQVLLADDHPVVREGIRNLLDSAVGIKVVGEARNGKEAYHLVEALAPDVLLLDVELPGWNGVELAKKLLDDQLKVKILVLSSYSDTVYISEMLAMGAHGYLIKDEVPKRIVEAVRGVAAGQQGWVSREVAMKLGKIMQKQEHDHPLTTRETEVLKLVVEGATNSEIAYRLQISEKTVEKHLRNVYQKLDVRSRVEAAVTAVQTGLVED